MSHGPGGPDPGGRDLRVVHLSTDDVMGGAAVAAHRLHRGLTEAGVDSRMLVRRRRSDDPRVRRFEAEDGFADRLRHRWRQWRIRRDHRRYRDSRPEWCEAFTDDRSPFAGEVREALGSCDLVHLHWVARFVDYRDILELTADGIPVVWTLHDMNPFTGGCHYDAGCGRYTEACGACPQLGSDDLEDLSREIWRRKREAYESIPAQNLRLVTPSRWLERQVSRSSLAGDRFRVETIPNGVDTEDFAPRDRESSRALVGVPRDARVVLFVAHDPCIHRKGFTVLAEVLEDLADVPDLHLVSLGKGCPKIEASVPHHHLGFVSHDRMLSAVYSAADLFVIPSLQDNLPTTVLESMACGTPVVGFEAGGIPEMVRPEETGAVAPVGDVERLAKLLAGLLDAPRKRRRLGDRCRELAVEEYGVARQARRYERLYRRLVSRSAGSGGAGERVGSGPGGSIGPQGTGDRSFTAGSG